MSPDNHAKTDRYKMKQDTYLTLNVIAFIVGLWACGASFSLFIFTILASTPLAIDVTALFVMAGLMVVTLAAINNLDNRGRTAP